MCILCELFIVRRKFGEIMKKNDILLIIFLLFLSIILYIFNTLFSQSGNMVVIYSDNKEEFSLPLSENKELDINGTNTVCIKEGSVFMKSASCPDRLCVHQRPLTSSGREIVCLPNKVVIKVISQNKASIDAISQ